MFVTRSCKLRSTKLFAMLRDSTEARFSLMCTPLQRDSFIQHVQVITQIADVKTSFNTQLFLTAIAVDGDNLVLSDTWKWTQEDRCRISIIASSRCDRGEGEWFYRDVESIWCIRTPEYTDNKSRLIEQTDKDFFLSAREQVLQNALKCKMSTVERINTWAADPAESLPSVIHAKRTREVIGLCNLNVSVKIQSVLFAHTHLYY